MKTGFLKPFLSALVGSAMLLVTLFVIAGMRTDTNIAQASALQSTALATDATTPLTLTLAVEEEATFCDPVVTFDVSINVTPTKALTGIIMVDSKNISFTILADKTMTTADHTLILTKVIQVKAQATVYSGTGVFTSKPISFTMNPCIQFAANQANKAKIAQAIDFAAVVKPDVLTSTKDLVDFSFGDGKTSSETLSNTNTVSTSHIYTKTGTYNVSAEYTEGVYGGGDTAEMTVTVTGPGIAITAPKSKDTFKSSEAITLEAKITEPLSDSQVSFCSTAAVSGAIKTTLGTTKMVTNTTATFAYTLPTVQKTTVYTLDSKLMYEKALVARATPITITVTAPITEEVCTDKYTIDLSASATEIKTSDMVTATATVKNGTAPVSGTSVLFTKSGVGELKSSTTATTNKDGKAIVMASSTTTGTMTIEASAKYCEGTKTATNTVSINVVSGEIPPTPPTPVKPGEEAKFGTEGTKDYVAIGCATTAISCSFSAYCEPSTTPTTETEYNGNATLLGYFGCDFTGLDATDGEFYIKWNQEIATTGLAATISTTETQLLKLGVLQGNTWVTNYDNTITSVTGLATVNTVMTSDKVSDTSDYAKLVDSEMIYLPIVFR